jgi:hypothetical protein
VAVAGTGPGRAGAGRVTRGPVVMGACYGRSRPGRPSAVPAFPCASVEGAATDPFGGFVSRHPGSTRGRAALVAASGAMLLVAGIWFAHDRHSGVGACGSRGPTGSTPCLYDCGVHSTPLGSPPEDATAPCLYDPSGKGASTTSTFGPPPTTAPDAGPSTPHVPPPARSG